MSLHTKIVGKIKRALGSVLSYTGKSQPDAEISGNQVVSFTKYYMRREHETEILESVIVNIPEKMIPDIEHASINLYDMTPEEYIRDAVALKLWIDRERTDSSILSLTRCKSLGEKKVQTWKFPPLPEKR